MMASAVVALLLLSAAAAFDDDVDVTRWDIKSGFVPGTKDDVETGFMTVEAAKKRCEQLAACLAITYRDKADVKTEVHVYLKQDSTVSETDKTWTSMVKRPAGLMDVNFINELAFPLELCWLDLIGSAAPVCYGTVQPGSSKNMTSYAGHNFVLKRLVWSLTASAAALASGAMGGAVSPQLARALASGGEQKIAITARQRAHEWESPLALTSSSNGGSRGVLAAASASDTTALAPLQLVNRLSQPAEVCSAPQWAARLLQASMPMGLETCHGVVSAGGSLTVEAIGADRVLLARQLVGVATIQKHVANYTLEQQQLSADMMRKMVKAMGSSVGPSSPSLPPPAAPPPKPPPPRPPQRPPGSNSPPQAVEWAPLLGTAAESVPALRTRCEQLHSGPSTAPAAAAAAQLLPRMLAAVLSAPDAPVPHMPSACTADDACKQLAAASGLSEAALAPGSLAERRWRALQFLRQQAPQLAATVGGQPLVLLAAAAASDEGENALDVALLEPLHAALALAIGGVKKLAVRWVPDAASSPRQAWEVWACAAGFELSWLDEARLSAAVAVDGLGGQSGAGAAGGGAPLGGAVPPTERAHLVLSGSSLAWWDAVRGYAAEDAMVLGVHLAGAAASSTANEPPAVHSFVSTRAHALGFHLGGDASGLLGGVPCDSCASAATSLLRADCDMSAAAVQSALKQDAAAWSVFELVLEVAAGWPVGYRLADRCAGLAEHLGVEETSSAEVGGVRAMCQAHGCSAGGAR